jgi:hypothetical protein
MSHQKQRWEDAEVQKLVDLWDKDVPIADIAERLKRRPEVVRAKVSSLRRNYPKLKKQLRMRTLYPNYKLTATQIPAIRKDKRSLQLIGLQYKVSPVTIFKIKARVTWRNA